MPHFRLRKTDALDDRESLECDQPTIEGALADFGNQLNVVLALEGDVFQYVLESRPYDVPDFKDSDKVLVYGVNPKD